MPERPVPSSPTWENLLLGVFVLPFNGDTDPTAGVDVPPNGTTVLWESAAGARYIATFLRATGWKSVQVT